MFPVLPVFSEGRHTAEFLKSEAKGYRSRGNIQVAAGSGVLMPGTVLGLIAAGAAAAAVNGGNVGNGTISAVTTGAAVEPGAYAVEFTTATAFRVVDPDGDEVGLGKVGTAFTGPIGFTITAGATAFAAGDGFTVTVAPGSNLYVPVNEGAVDGSAVAAAILYHRVDATLITVDAAAIQRDAEVYGSRLVYDPSVASPAQLAAIAAQLAAVGILLR